MRILPRSLQHNDAQLPQTQRNSEEPAPSGKQKTSDPDNIANQMRHPLSRMPSFVYLDQNDIENIIAFLFPLILSTGRSAWYCAEQLAGSPPFNPAQLQLHGPLPLTALSAPELQRLVVGIVVNDWPLAKPHAPSTAPGVNATYVVSEWIFAASRRPTAGATHRCRVPDIRRYSNGCR